MTAGPGGEVSRTVPAAAGEGGAEAVKRDAHAADVDSGDGARRPMYESKTQAGCFRGFIPDGRRPEGRPFARRGGWGSWRDDVSWGPILLPRLAIKRIGLAAIAANTECALPVYASDGLAGGSSPPGWFSRLKTELRGVHEFELRR